jgi:putative transposase
MTRSSVTRFLADEARAAGLVFADRTAWRICSDNGWWSVFGKKRRGKKTKVGAAAHEDLVRRDFTSPAQNQLWLTDLTEHQTRKGRCTSAQSRTSGRTGGYSMSDRMESQIALDAGMGRPPC